MPYGWSMEVELLLSHMWVDYGSLMTLLNTFKFKSFMVKAQRDLMRTALENLKPASVFSEEKRFIDKRIWIDLNHSVPCRILRQMTMALDSSDRQTEKGREHGESIDKRDQSNLEDAKVAFYSALDQMLDLVGPLPIESAHVVGVYIQSTFESEHGLVWT